jgi:hypothetical protein
VKRHARRRDDNERPIVDALRRAGWSVQLLDANGAPDILAGKGDLMVLFEVKRPDGGVETRSVHRGRGNTLEGPLAGLTPDQREWWAHWKGPAPVIVQSAEEALRAIGAIR